MKNSIFTKSLQILLSVCFDVSLVTLCVCCSKAEVESIQTFLEEEILPYDSAYNASCGLYVIDNDTISYNLQDYNSPLNSEEKMICKFLNEYAGKLLADYSGTNSENTMLSPFSASMLYSLMANFTDEQKNYNAFKESMGISSANNKDINSFFRKYLNKSCQPSKFDANEEQLSFDSNLWMDKKSAVYKSFLSTAKYYDFGVKGVDLERESSIDAINNFVNAKIGSNDALINKSSIEYSKPLVTASMTFKGEWEEKFVVDSAQTNLFENINGSKTHCKVFRSTRKGRYSNFDTFDMIEIPYKGGVYSMFIVLPHTADGLSGSLTELQKQGVVRCMDLVSDTTRTYHGEYLIPRDTITNYGSYTVVDTLITDTIFDIRIPKFKLCASTGLNPKNIVGNSATKLMYQTNLPKVSPNGYSLSNVFQSCSFEINELSTSASSDGFITVIGTYTGNSKYSIDPGPFEGTIPKGRIIKETVVVPYHVLHPFAVFIRENQIGTIPFACSIKTLNF